MSRARIYENCSMCGCEMEVDPMGDILMVEWNRRMMPMCKKCHEKINDGRHKNLTFDEYQSSAQETAIYPGQGTPKGALYTVLGLCGEVGEIAELALQNSLSSSSSFGLDFSHMNWEQSSLFIVVRACRIAAILSKAMRDSGGMLYQSQDAEIESIMEDLENMIADYRGFHTDCSRDSLKGIGMDMVDSEEVKKEFGDCLWFGAQLMKEFGVSMSDSASKNIEKLASRKKRGVIGGDGGDR